MSQQQDRIIALESEFHDLTIQINLGNVDVNALDAKRLGIYEEIRVLKRLQFQKNLEVVIKNNKLGNSLTGINIPYLQIYYLNKLN